MSDDVALIFSYDDQIKKYVSNFLIFFFIRMILIPYVIIPIVVSSIFILYFRRNGIIKATDIDKIMFPNVICCRKYLG